MTGIAGLIAVFVSDNQAGSALALLLAGVFLLIGLQGTPLVRVGSGEHSFELERRREFITVLAADTAQTSPEQAAALLEGYAIADPGLRHARAYIYQFELQVAMNGLRLRDQRWEVSRPELDDLPDFIVRTPEGAVIAVEAKYWQSVRRDRVKAVIERLATRMETPGTAGAVLIMNLEASARGAMREARRHAGRLKVVHWASQYDNERLYAVFEELRQVKEAND